MLKALDRLAADALRRAIGSDQLGVFGFQLLQLLQQPVELPVGDLGPGLDVIEVVVVVDESPQFLCALAWRCHDCL